MYHLPHDSEVWQRLRLLANIFLLLTLVFSIIRRGKATTSKYHYSHYLLTISLGASMSQYLHDCPYLNYFIRIDEDTLGSVNTFDILRHCVSLVAMATTSEGLSHTHNRTAR